MEACHRWSVSSEPVGHPCTCTGGAASPPPRVWVPWGTNPHARRVRAPRKKEKRDLDKGLLVWHTQPQADLYTFLAEVGVELPITSLSPFPQSPQLED